MSKSIIKESKELREGLKNRFKELGLTLSKVSEDAETFGIKISIHSLSKYLTNSNVTNLTEEVIVWLSFRWGIYVFVIIGTPSIKDDQFRANIMPYDEQRCLAMLNRKYGVIQKEEVAKPKRLSKRSVKA